MRYLILALLLLSATGLLAVCDTLFLCFDWNNVSVSVETDASIDSLFHGLDVYEMIGGTYNLVDSIIPGKGYAVYPTGIDTLVFCGPPLERLPELELSPGWCLVGAPWVGWAPEDIITIPPDIIDPTETRVYTCDGIEMDPFRVDHGQAAMVLALSNGFITTGIKESSSTPVSFALSAYPNPFNSSVTISLSVIPGLTRNPEIEIYDLNGRRIAEIIPPGPPFTRGEEDGKSPLSKGRKVRCRDLGGLVWQPDASLGSGVYLIRVSIGEKSVAKRVVYLK